MIKLAAIVIVYNPDFDLLCANISRYYKVCDTLLIWQNSMLSDSQIRYLTSKGNIILMGNGSNCGISNVLNTILLWCNKHDFHHLLMMDQDSLFEDFDQYLKYAYECMSTRKSCIEVGPEINIRLSDECDFLLSDYVITSGAIVDVCKALEIGGFNEHFFIDGIDIDFGYRAKSKGYDIYKVGGSILNQRYGDDIQCKTRDYRPYRLYEIMKSHWIIFFSYYPFSKRFTFWNYYYRCVLPDIIFNQKAKIRKTVSIVGGTIVGIIVGIFYRLKNN